jgi:hypothetical protein
MSLAVPWPLQGPYCGRPCRFARCGAPAVPDCVAGRPVVSKSRTSIFLDRCFQAPGMPPETHTMSDMPRGGNVDRGASFERGGATHSATAVPEPNRASHVNRLGLVRFQCRGAL